MASAQGPAPRSASTPKPRSESVWRLTFRGGGGLVNKPAGGTPALPTPGATLSLPGLTTRQVPSWYFGDGSTILNGFLGRSTHAIAPLDGTLTGPSIVRRSGASFGATLSRTLSARWRLDVSIDGARTAPTFTSAARSAIEASRASFQDAWTFFLTPSGSPAGSPSVTSTAKVVNGAGLEWLATGAIDITLMTMGRSTVYATVGGGIASAPGANASATLVGHYAFAFVLNPNVPFDETDTITVRSTRASRAVAVFGGGWTHELSRRWGLDADVRLLLSGNGVKTVVDATPARVLQTDRSKEIVLGIGPSPGIVFDNATGDAPPFISTLSAAPLSGFTTFTGSGMQLRVLVSGGLFLRF